MPKNGRSAEWATVVAERRSCISRGIRKNSGRKAFRKMPSRPASRSFRKIDSASRISRSEGEGKPVTWPPTRRWAFTPVNSEVWPVALWGMPSTPRQASIGRAQPPQAAGRGSAPEASPGGAPSRRNTSPP